MINKRVITCIVVFTFLSSVSYAAVVPVKSPNVAGGFYPSDPVILAHNISQFIQQAGDINNDASVEVMIAPHAGYQYSGSVAGYAYKSVSKNPYKTIVIIAPSHFYPFNGAAIWPKGVFQTPLGNVAIDEDFALGLMGEVSNLKASAEVFNQEHAVEVEIPFIQQTFPNAKIVPILMGQPNINDCQQLAQGLNKMIGDRRDVLVIISSDMSHYHPYEEAKRIDQQTLKLIEALNIQEFWNGNLNRTIEMCGFVPVTVGMFLAAMRNHRLVNVLKYANSGDTAGDKAKVVGYSSITFSSAQQVLTDREKKDLLAVAKHTLDEFVRTGKASPNNITDKRLLTVQGAFVTLKIKGQLRGCIGNIIGQEPLAATITAMTIAAASQDPRFKPVTVNELADIELEISVLSPPTRVISIDDIVLGKHGVIVSDGGSHQGVFLPQVYNETHWSKEQFLSELCAQKAGLSADAWKDPSTQFYVFTADVFHE